MEIICKTLPKIELHAHLNGSLSDETMLELLALKNEEEKQITNFKIEKGHSRTLSECFEIFKIAHALTDTPKAIQIAVKNTLQEFNDDGVIYLELRSTPRENRNMTKHEYIQAMVDAVDESSKFLQMKTFVLVSIDRRNSFKEAEHTLNVAIDMHKKYPNIIVGMDLSGDPKVANFKDFILLLNEARNAGLKVTIHAGEIPNEEETLEIIKWKPDRLGHMTCYSEIVLKHLFDSKIPVELCLTSNLKCKSVTSYNSHQFKPFFDNAHPICISTDDKGVFSTSLSEEFYICTKVFELNEDQLLYLCFSAVEQIFAGEDVKDDLLAKLNIFKNNL